MALRTLAGLVLAAILTTACDEVTQKKPQTVSGIGRALPALSTSGHGAASGTVQGPVEARSVSGADASMGERSIRLFGRGVHRQRQIRV